MKINGIYFALKSLCLDAGRERLGKGREGGWRLEGGHLSLLVSKLDTVKADVTRRGNLNIIFKSKGAVSFQKPQGKSLHLSETSGKASEIYPFNNRTKD